MESIILSKELSIKKLDPLNEKDVWLAKELDKDSLIYGKNGYLWSIENEFRNVDYLQRNGIYHAPYAIYHEFNPIGFMEISEIFQTIGMVDIAYALLETYRGKGYATKTLKAISKIILTDVVNDVKKVALIIDPNNIKSQRVAERAGFISEGLSRSKYIEQGYIGYHKTKAMLK